MRLLVLSYYFPPDIGPGAFRTAAAVEALRERLGPGDSLDVIAMQPHRHVGACTATPIEIEESFSLRRVGVVCRRSSPWCALVNFVRYSSAVLRQVQSTHYDVVYASSARWMTAALGARVAARTGARLYVDLRDLVATDVAAVYPAISPLLMPALHALEHYVLSRADGVNLVSPAFVRYLGSRWRGRDWDVVPNGIDSEIAEFDFHPPPGYMPRHRLVLYAGNIGHGQALHKIVPPLAERLRDGYRFEIIGDGSARAHLSAAVAHLPHVRLCEQLPRSQLVARYAAADVLFLHLDRSAAFDLVLPSKLIEYAATGKPILAGVAGYAAEFTRRNIAGSSVFPPCDVDAAARALAQMPSGCFPRTAFLEAYQRRSQMRALADNVVALAGDRTVPVATPNG